MSLKFLVVGDAENLPSSYGQELALFKKWLKSKGHSIVHAAKGASTATYYNGNLHLRETDTDGYSQRTIAKRARRFKPDIVLSMVDLHVLNPELYPGVRHVPYFPADKIGFQPEELGVLVGSWDSVTFSQFALEQLKPYELDKHGINVKYAPLGVDCELFTPGPGRQPGDGDDVFLFGVVAANSDPHPSRKNWYGILAAFSSFVQSLEGGVIPPYFFVQGTDELTGDETTETVPVPLHASKKPVLYLHTNTYAIASKVGGGVANIDLEELVERFGLQDNVIFPNQDDYFEGLTPQVMMADMYRKLDCLIHVGNEGFGLPGVEAAACGIPVIGCDWTTTAETSLAGINLRQADHATNYPVPNLPGSFRYEVRPEALAHAFKLITTWDEATTAQVKAIARERAEQFHYEAVFEAYWSPILAEWESRVLAENVGKQGAKRAPHRPGIGKNGKDYEQEIIRANETEATTIILCPSWGESCGIAYYAQTQSYEFGKAGIPNVIATTTEEVSAIARACPRVKYVIAHHEPSFFDNQVPHLGRGEATVGFTRTLKALQDEIREQVQFYGGGGRPGFKVSVVMHTVHPENVAINAELKKSGLDLYATSVGGANHMGAGLLPLGTWEVPGYVNRDTQTERNGRGEGKYWSNRWRDGAGDFGQAFTKGHGGYQFNIGNFGFYGSHRDIDAQIELCRLTGSQFVGSFAVPGFAEPGINAMTEKIRKELVDALATAQVPSTGLWTDWCDSRELLERLERADVLYMPRNTGAHWYSSATVMMALLLGIPVIVNRDAGYSDLQDILIVANTVEEAAAAIERLRSPSEYRSAVEKILKYREARTLVSIYRGAGVVG